MTSKVLYTRMSIEETCCCTNLYGIAKSLAVGKLEHA